MDAIVFYFERKGSAYGGRGQTLNRLTPQASSRFQGMTPATDPVRHNFLRLDPFLFLGGPMFGKWLN